MPARAKGARLYLRERKGREPVYVILATGRPEVSTGTADRLEAERQLAEYITRQQRAAGPATPDNLTIADVLAIYGEEHAPTTTATARIGYAISALPEFWGDLPVSAVTGATCRRYGKARAGVGNGTVRREPGTLQAALNYCEAERDTSPVRAA